MVEIPSVDQRDRDFDTVLGRRPQPLRRIVVAVVAAAHRLFLDDRSRPRLHVVVDRRPRCGEGRVEKAHHPALVVRARSRICRVGGVRLLDHMETAG